MSEESHRTQAATTAIVRSEVYTQHDAGLGHPESPYRYTAIINALEGADFAYGLQWLDPPAADGQEIARCHLKGCIDLARLAHLPRHW